MGRKIEDLVWVGGQHDFALNLGQIEALQDRCDAGPEYIMRSLNDGTWRQEYIFETLKQGLIGAGMHAVDAGNLMKKIKEDNHPLRELIHPAHLCLIGALIGVEGDEPKKSAGEAPTNDLNSPEENGASPTSTAPPPS